MTVAAADVLAEAGAGAVDTALATRVLAEANLHVAAYITETLLVSTVTVPTAINDSAVLRCAVDLFVRAKAPLVDNVLPDGSVVPAPRRADPLGGVRPLLARWCGPDMGIA